MIFLDQMVVSLTEHGLTMSPTQEIFTVFFAIFWGFVANVQSRWKAFHYTFFFRIKETRKRLYLALITLNALPIIYYCILISSDFMFTSNSTQWVVISLKGILPAFATFGFYRLFLACVDFSPTTFYRDKVNNKEYPDSAIEPTVESLTFPPNPCERCRNAASNLLFSLLYILGGPVLALSLDFFISELYRYW